MNNEPRQVIAQLRNSPGSIGKAAREIAGGTMDLSNRMA